ncbi:MAG: hypothetical protein ACI9D0_000530 [Bacteroidia bacterium]|jgi:hypothetical protein
MRVLFSFVSLASLVVVSACSGTSTPTVIGGSGIAQLEVPSVVPGPAHEILAAATSMEIISLHPYDHDLEAQGLTGAPKFFNYAELGRATLTDPAKMLAVVEAVYGGINASDGTVAACFSPRHGIHAEVDGKPVDFVICYHCLSMHIHVEGERNPARTTEAPGEVLTKIWEEAGLTIQKDD